MEELKLLRNIDLDMRGLLNFLVLKEYHHEMLRINPDDTYLKTLREIQDGIQEGLRHDYARKD